MAGPAMTPPGSMDVSQGLARAWRRAVILAAVGAAFLWIACSAASAATQVPAGSMASDETWTASNSPYQLAGDLRVPRGITLTLDQGTTVEAPGGARIVVEGELRAFGNPGNMVSFGPSAGSWGGIVVNLFGNASIFNATVLGADRGLLASTAGSVYLADVTFRGTLTDAVLVSQQTTSVYLQKVTVDGAARGIVAQAAFANVTASRLSIKATQFCVVLSGASHVALLNFSMTGCTDAAINISTSSDIQIYDGNVTEWDGAVVAAISASRLNITANRVYTLRPALGFRLVGLSNSAVEGNVLNMLQLPAGVGAPFDVIAIDVDSPLGPNRVEQNTIRGFSQGIRVRDAIFGQRIATNTIYNGSDTGIELLDSTNQTLVGNTIWEREYPFAVNVTAEGTPQYFRHTIDANNTVNGSSLRYLVGLVDASIDLAGSGVAIFALVDARNVTVTNPNLTRGIPALIVANSVNVAVRDGQVQSNITGVEVYNGTRTLLSNLEIDGGMTCVRFRGGADNRATALSTTRCIHGVLTEGQETRLLVDNITLSNGTGRIAFFEGVDLTLRDSRIVSLESTAFSNAVSRIGRAGQAITLLGKPRGVQLFNVTIEGTARAIILEGFSNITLTEVTVAQSETAVTLRKMSQVTLMRSQFAGWTYGVLATNLTDSLFQNTTFVGANLEGLFCVGCSNVSVLGNIFSGNQVGLSFVNGSRSLVAYNSFFFNTLHATSDSAVNDFDDGAVGNLWDDYSGLDANGDGIGDTPYTIATGIDQDRYPIARFPDSVGPTADAGPDIVAVEDMPVFLSGYLSTDNVGIRVFLWNFNDGGTNVTVTGLSTRYVFRTPGTYVVTLTVIDWGANRASDSLVVTILDRTPPHADGGGDRTVDEDVPVTLDARASFDNDPLFPAGSAFTWWVTDSNGTFAVIGRLASWTFATPGNFTVVLIVDDAAGFSDETEFVVTVLDKTPPSIAPLTAPDALEDFPFRAYGSAVTDNDPLWPLGMEAWFELRKAGALVEATNASPAIFNVSDPGPYTLHYYVRDRAGNVGVATVVFEVDDITPPDLHLFVERTAEAGVPFPMDVSLAADNNPTFPAGADVSWTVQLPSGSVTLDGASVEFTFLTIGDWNVALHIRDAGGNLAEKSFVVHVRDTRAPEATIEAPSSVEAGEEATLRATATDPSGISSYAWYITGLSTPRTGSTLVYRFFTPGSYQITLRVEDLLGHVANVSATLFVVDTRPPEVSVFTTPAMRNGTVSLAMLATLQVTYLGIDPSLVVAVEWAWGDGNISNGTSASHDYWMAGNFTVLVRVQDGAGNANTTTFLVDVTGPPAIDPPDGGDGTPTVPTSGGIPLLGLVAIIAAVGVAGALVGLRIGKRGHVEPPVRPKEKEE